MLSFWTLVKWAHVLGAVIWLGGVFFVVFMLRPALQSVPEMHVRRFVLGQSVARMRKIMNVVITMQVLTGVYMVWQRVPSWELLTAGAWGRVLLAKVGLASIMVALYVVVPRLLLAGPDHTCDEIQGPPLKQKLGNLLHIVLLVLGFATILLAKLLTA